MVVTELVNLLRWQVKGQTEADKYKESLEKIRDGAKEAAKQLLVAATAVIAFTREIASGMTEQYEWAQSIGLSTESLQRFEHAALSVGGSLNDLQGDLEKYALYADSMGVTVEEIFLQMADNIKGMTTQQSRYFLQSQGFSESSIRMIQKGRGELQKMFSEAELVPEDGYKDSQNFMKLWRETMEAWKKTLQSAMVEALPIIRDVIKDFGDFVRENKALVASNIAGFFKAVAITVKALWISLQPLIATLSFLSSFLGEDLTAVLTSVIITIMGLSKVCIMLGGAITYVIPFFTTLIPAIWGAVTATIAWTAALLANPVTWIVIGIVALIAAIVLLIKNFDKVSEWFRAFGSLITDAFTTAAGKVSAWFSKIKDMAMEVWNSIVGKAKEVFESIKSFFLGIWEAVVGVWETIIEAWDTAVTAVQGFFDWLWEKVKAIFDLVMELVTLGFWESSGESTDKQKKKGEEIKRRGESSQKEGVRTPKAGVQVKVRVPSSVSNSSSSTVVNNNTVVNASGASATEVVRRMNQQRPNKILQSGG